MDITERDLAQAREHPRGTERRTLGPYREALNDAAAYALLEPSERDVIVRWAEIRRRLRLGGLDHDEANLADPLIAYEALRDLVVRGESLDAAALGADDDLRAAVERARASRAR